MAEEEMMTFVLANLIPMGIAATMLGAAFAARRFMPMITMSATLLVLHGAIVLGTVVPALFGKGGGEPPFDDIYFPFFLYPGILLYWLNSRIADLLWPWLEQHVGYHEGSYLCIVVIPALLTTLAGAFFWMLVGRFLQKIKREEPANQRIQAIGGPRTPQPDA